MNVNLKTLTMGVLFFTGQALVAQEVKSDSTKKENQIEEVVFVGFGKKQTVKEATGSIGKVGKEIADMSSASVDKALVGKIAGVQGGVSTGQPGGAAFVRVRGISSINGRNNPIIIIDGVRVAQGDLTSNTTTANILANLNEADIENVTILKDAVSTAVYGADAGAGVMIITTKSGRKGKARFNLSNEYGVSYRAITGHEPLNATEWKGLLVQGLANKYSQTVEQVINQIPSVNALPESNASEKAFKRDLIRLASFYNNPNNTDWRKAAEKSGGALMHRVNASVSGGNDRFTYYSSLGYFDQEGIVKSSSFKRISGSTRLTYKATDRLTLGTDFQMSYGVTNTVSEGGNFSNPIMAQYFLLPIERVRNEDGSYNFGRNGRLSNGLFNSVALQELNYQRAKTAKVFANIQADYKIAKNLNYKFVIAPEYINIEEDQYNSPLHGDGRNIGGALYSYSTRFFNFNIQNILSYSFKLGDKNNFNASLIQEAYRSDKRLLGATGNVVGSTNLFTLDSFIIPRRPSGRKNVDSRGGYAVTFHYDYDKLFLLDLSGRQDRVSNFWTDKQTGYFWSAGIGLDLARLEFLKSIDAISQLKFTASYGLVGNLPSSSVSPYSVYSYVGNYDDKAAARPQGMNNIDLEWEKINPLNIGFDLGLLNGKLTLSAAYYNKRTHDLVFDVPYSPSQAGYTLISGTPYPNRWENIGSMRNSGFEFTLGARIFDTEDFKWSINANLSTLNNKVLSLKNGADIITGTSILREGEVANAFYMRKWAGVDPTNGNPLWYKNGIDGETTSDYNEAGKAIQGSRYAKLFGGLDTQVSFRGFSLDAQFSYGFGNKIYDRWANYLMSDGSYTATYSGYKAQMDYWTPENRDALNPAPIYGLGNNNASQASTRFLYKGDYVRLRTVKLSYTFNKGLLGKSGLDSVQIYVLGNNLWTYTFDKNLKFDPDLQISGNANLTIPPLKTYSLGVNLTF